MPEQKREVELVVTTIPLFQTRIFRDLMLSDGLYIVNGSHSPNRFIFSEYADEEIVAICDFDPKKFPYKALRTIIEMDETTPMWRRGHEQAAYAKWKYVLIITDKLPEAACNEVEELYPYHMWYPLESEANLRWLKEAVTSGTVAYHFN